MQLMQLAENEGSFVDNFSYYQSLEYATNNQDLVASFDRKPYGILQALVSTPMTLTSAAKHALGWSWDKTHLP